MCRIHLFRTKDTDERIKLGSKFIRWEEIETDLTKVFPPKACGADKN
jgi:hypothetical protein